MKLTGFGLGDKSHLLRWRRLGRNTVLEKYILSMVN